MKAGGSRRFRVASATVALVAVAAGALLQARPARATSSVTQLARIAPGVVDGGSGTALALSSTASTALIGVPSARGSDGEVLVYVRRAGGWSRQGPPLIVDCRRRCGGAAGTGEDGNTYFFGSSVALSGDGTTALIGAPGNGERGAAWVFVRRRGRWHQQGSRLIAFCDPTRRRCVGPNGTGLGGYAFGSSVALSRGGSLALIGAPGGRGAAWVFVRSARGGWSQQAKLTGRGAGYAGVNTGEFGTGAALSADGRTALIGAGGDVDGGIGGAGAAFVFVRSAGGSWSQDGPKLRGTGEVGDGAEGQSVAISADARMAVLGAPRDNNLTGAAWVFARTAGGGGWVQDGAKLLGGGEVNRADFGGQFGSSVAFDSAGTRLLIGGPDDGGCSCDLAFGPGAAWLFDRQAGSGSRDAWAQDGSKLTATGEVNRSIPGEFGTAAAIDSDGHIAFVGAPNDNCHARCDGSVGSPGDGAAYAFSLR
jgi:hypothetical protein